MTKAGPIIAPLFLFPQACFSFLQRSHLQQQAEQVDKTGRVRLGVHLVPTEGSQFFAVQGVTLSKTPLPVCLESIHKLYWLFTPKIGLFTTNERSSVKR